MLVETVVTSLDVAETFGKEHKRVMQDIRELECSEEFNQHNFVPIDYTDSRNRKQPMFYMTRDGFTLLVMGYTGEKAMRFKEAYIKQFNQMEELLKGKLIEREKGIAVRQSLKNAKQLREEFGIDKKANLRDCFTAEELAKVQSIEMIVSGLVNCGWGYNEIKHFITSSTLKLTAA